MTKDCQAKAAGKPQDQKFGRKQGTNSLKNKWEEQDGDMNGLEPLKSLHEMEPIDAADEEEIRL